MKFSFGKRNPNRQRHSQNEAITKETTVGELTVSAFSAFIDALVDVRIRIVKDELHLHFDEQLKAKDKEIKALKVNIKDLNTEIEAANRVSRKSKMPRTPHSVIPNYDHIHN